VNRLSEHQHEGGTLVPVDPERHALEVRIERAKGRIVEDLNRASGLLRDVARRTGRRLGTALVLSGVILGGIVIAAFVRRSRRRVRITWR
jgi:hypothetical protein